MKALIHGYFGMGNVGDEAILSVLIKELKSKSIEPVVLSADPNRTTRLHGVASCHDKLLSLEFWRYLLNSSTLVFAGGGRYGRETMRRMCVLTILAKILGKRVEFRALGIYSYRWIGLPVIMDSPRPFNDLLTRTLVRIAFRLADKVSVRDSFSRRVLEVSGVARRVDIEEDLAFKLKPSRPEDSAHILSQHGVDVSCKPLVGVNIRTLHENVRGRVVDVISKFLDWLIASGAEVVFIPFGYGSTPERFFDNDLIVADELRKHMKMKGLKIIDKEYNPQEVLGMFTFFDLFIGMRFHSIVFSSIIGVPTIAIIYDTKTAELLKKRDMCRCIYFTIDELSVDKLRNAVKALLGFEHG